MRLLITGSNGLLGQKLLQTAPSSLFDIYGCDVGEASVIVAPGLRYQAQDLTDPVGVASLIDTALPEVIVHCAALTNVDGCETERALCWKINVEATRQLVIAAEKIHAKLIFISTDYVFDGKKKEYFEDDRPNPLSYYGRSKLAAENVIRGSKLDNWTIIRTIVLYGHGINPRSSFVSWVLSMLSSGKSPNIVTDQISNMTFVDDLAKAILSVILRDFRGIIHVGGVDIMSRYQFAGTLAEIFGLNKDMIKPIVTADLHQPAVRPLYSVLNINRAVQELDYSPLTVVEALTEYKKQVETATPNPTMAAR